jgi:alkanesulfonate monooxygenase SsuD/methylene tetrahydromethanopterin reductase-like flavin-dependent oxidoreductase (luciferase family)
MASHDLTFGVFIPQGWKMELSSIADPQDKWAKAVEVAVLADELDLDSLWVYDHFHNVPTPAHETMFECWTTLAAISQRTSRIKLGQMVGCAPYRNPGLLAKITSNIDVMSGGRLIWGVGAGWYEHEFKGYGYEFPKAADRIRLLRETVEIVKAMWTQPVVARHADTANFGGKPHEWQHKAEVLQQHCKDVGRDYDEIRKTISSEVFIRETEREVLDAGSQSFWGEPAESWRAGNLVGTPEQVAEKIRTYVDLGCTGFYPWCSDYPDTETLRLFAQVAADLR